MKIVKKLWRTILTIVALVIALDALVFFAIILWPDSEFSKFASRYEPVFNYLQQTKIRAEEKKASLDFVPARPNKVTYVQGDHFISIAPGHPIFARPDIESRVMGKTTKAVNLQVLQEQDGWYQLEFSTGKGWIHPFVSARFIEGPPKQTARVETKSDEEEILDLTEKDQMQVEMTFEPDDGRRPDAIYFEHLQERRRPVLFNELFAEYDPTDLAALPPGVNPARLQLATQLLGENAQQKKVGDFIIRYQSQKWADRSAELLEGLRQTYFESFSSILSSDISERVAYIFLMPSLDAYNEFFSDAFEKGSMQAAGHYESGLIAIHPRVRKQEDANRTLIHESTHHFNHVLLGISGRPKSVWLDEGLATYFGMSKIDKNKRIIPGQIASGGLSLEMGRGYDPRVVYNAGSAKQKIALLKGELRSGRALRLRQLMSLEGSEFYQGRVLLNYSTAWMLVHFLMHGKDGKYRDNFMEYLDYMRSNEVSPQKFAVLIGASLEVLAKELRNYILSR